jgi:myosin-5
MYLSNKDSVLPNINDGEEFKVTKNCMESVGLDESLQRQVFAILAGILHLGNVQFGEDDSEGQVGGILPSRTNAFSAAATCLGVSESDLLFALTKQNMYVSGHTIVKMQTQAQVKKYFNFKLLFNINVIHVYRL